MTQVGQKSNDGKNKPYNHQSGKAGVAKLISDKEDFREQKITRIKRQITENQDGGVGRHTAPPRTTRTDRESNSKGDQHQENRK